MSAPRVVLQPVDGVLLVPVQGPVSAELLDLLRDEVLQHLQRHGGRGVVLDLGGVHVLDATDFEALRGVVNAASLMGVPAVLAAMRPGVAAALTWLDVDDSWVTAARSVDDALVAIP